MVVLVLGGLVVTRSCYLSHVATKAGNVAAKADAIAAPAATKAAGEVTTATKLQPTVDQAGIAVARAETKLKQDTTAAKGRKPIAIPPAIPAVTPRANNNETLQFDE